VSAQEEGPRGGQPAGPEGTSGAPASYHFEPAPTTREVNFAEVNFAHLARSHALCIEVAGGLSVALHKADELKHHLHQAGRAADANHVQNHAERLRLTAAQLAAFARRLAEGS
jgi:hypothetical protein